MKYRYDLHIHSGLSPCADKDMTPVTIVGYAKLNNIDFVAISDHNSISNVKVAIKAGEAFDVIVVPAFELQTAEDIHILCLFKTFESLESFYNVLKFQEIKNKPEYFGEQLVFDEDDNVIDKIDNLLLTSSYISSTQVKPLVKKYGGIAIPAHIDRESNSMLQILGSITDEYKVVEFSTRASLSDIKKESNGLKYIVDSDAHTLNQIGLNSEIELKNRSIDALFEELDK